MADNVAAPVAPAAADPPAAAAISADVELALTEMEQWTEAVPAVAMPSSLIRKAGLPTSSASLSTPVAPTASPLPIPVPVQPTEPAFSPVAAAPLPDPEPDQRDEVPADMFDRVAAQIEAIAQHHRALGEELVTLTAGYESLRAAVTKRLADPATGNPSKRARTEDPILLDSSSQQDALVSQLQAQLEQQQRQRQQLQQLVLQQEEELKQQQALTVQQQDALQKALSHQRASPSTPASSSSSRADEGKSATRPATRVRQLDAFSSDIDSDTEDERDAPPSRVPEAAKGRAEPARAIDVASAREVEVMTNIKVVIHDRCFVRKPRSLLAHPDASSPLARYMVTSCLNGTFQFWSIAKKAVSLQVDQKKLGCKWVEDMCWIDNGRALLLAMENDGQDPRRLLGISTVDAAAAAANGGSRIKCRFAHLNQEAAKETLNAVVGLGANQNSFQFAVAGNEKRVLLYDVERSSHTVLSTVPFGTKHTAAVQSLCSSRDRSTVFSGGADRKVFQCDVETSQASLLHTFGERVGSLSCNPVDNSLLLACLSARDKQLALVDTRFGRVVANFGSDEKESLSRYIVPSWHRDGVHVACGSASPLVNVWDIRYVALERPHQTIAMHSKRVLRTVWHPADDALYTISSDSALGCTSYRFQKKGETKAEY